MAVVLFVSKNVLRLITVDAGWTFGLRSFFRLHGRIHVRQILLTTAVVFLAGDVNMICRPLILCCMELNVCRPFPSRFTSIRDCADYWTGGVVAWLPKDTTTIRIFRYDNTAGFRNWICLVDRSMLSGRAMERYGKVVSIEFIVGGPGPCVKCGIGPQTISYVVRVEYGIPRRVSVRKLVITYLQLTVLGLRSLG